MFSPNTQARLKPGYGLEPSGDGFVLRHPAARRSVLVDADQRVVLDWLDGERSVEQILFEWCRTRNTIEVEPVLALLAELLEAGLVDADDETGAELIATRTFAGRLGGLFSWKRASGGLAGLLGALGLITAPLLGGPQALLFPLFAALGLWPCLTALQEPSGLLQPADSYLLGLAVIIAGNLLLSLLGTAACVGLQRRRGLGRARAFFGVTGGLPTLSAEIIPAPQLSPSQQRGLYLAGPAVEAALAALAAVAALYVPEPAAAALLLTATVGYVRVFVSLCPWAPSSLSQGVTVSLQLPFLQQAARQLLRGRLWQALGNPADVAERAAAAWAVYMILWAALALQVLRHLLLPQVPPLVAALASALPAGERIAAGLILGVSALAVGGALVWAGLLALLAVGRWVAAHPVWSRPDQQLIALLAVVVVALLGLQALSRALPEFVPALALGLGSLGALATWASGVLVIIQHRGGRVGLMALPLLLAALCVWLALLGQGALAAAAPLLLLTASYLLGLFAWGWALYLWRSPLAAGGLVVLTAPYLLGLLPMSPVPAAAQAVPFMAAASLLIMFFLQLRTRLAPLWLLTTLSAFVAVAAWHAVRPGVTGAEPLVINMSLALLLGAALLQWTWGAWSRGPLAAAPNAEAQSSPEQRLLKNLLAGYGAILGTAAAANLSRRATGQAPDEVAAQVRTVLTRLGQDLGPLVTRHVLSAATESLPWEQHLQLVADMGLAQWLTPPAPVQRAQVEALLCGSLVGAELGPSACERLARRVRLRRWEEGARLAAADSPALWLHLLVHGAATVTAPQGGDGTPLAVLSPGDSIGLEALQPGGRYPCQVRAVAETTTLSLHRDDLADLFSDQEQRTALSALAQQVRALRPISLFHDLAEAQVAAFLAKSRREPFANGDHLVRQGDPGDRFYVIRSGHVAVVAERDGQREAVAVLGPGSCFGELALLFNVPRTADVVAQSEGETLSLSRDDFLLLFPPATHAGRSLFHLSLARVLALSGDGTHDQAAPGEGS